MNTFRRSWRVQLVAVATGLMMAASALVASPAALAHNTTTQPRVCSTKDYYCSYGRQVYQGAAGRCWPIINAYRKGSYVYVRAGSYCGYHNIDMTGQRGAVKRGSGNWYFTEWKYCGWPGQADYGHTCWSKTKRISNPSGLQKFTFGGQHGWNQGTGWETDVEWTFTRNW